MLASMNEKREPEFNVPLSVSPADAGRGLVGNLPAYNQFLNDLKAVAL